MSENSKVYETKSIEKLFEIYVVSVRGNTVY